MLFYGIRLFSESWDADAEHDSAGIPYRMMRFIGHRQGDAFPAARRQVT